jgi:hypothetical protein
MQDKWRRKTDEQIEREKGEKRRERREEKRREEKRREEKRREEKRRRRGGEGRQVQPAPETHFRKGGA